MSKFLDLILPSSAGDRMRTNFPSARLKVDVVDKERVSGLYNRNQYVSFLSRWPFKSKCRRLTKNPPCNPLGGRFAGSKKPFPGRQNPRNMSKHTKINQVQLKNMSFVTHRHGLSSCPRTHPPWGGVYEFDFDLTSVHPEMSHITRGSRSLEIADDRPSSPVFL